MKNELKVTICRRGELTKVSWKRLHFFITVFTIFSVLCPFNPKFAVAEEKAIEYDTIQIDSDDDLKNIWPIYELDVFSYFKLDNKYNTPLKKEMFKKTKEYQDKLNELTKIRNQPRFFVVFIKRSDQCDFIRIDDTPCWKDYDINRKGFIVNLRKPLDGRAGYFGVPLRSLDDGKYYFPLSVNSGIKVQLEMFLPMGEEQGLLVENNKNDIGVAIGFYIEGVISTKAEPFKPSEKLFVAQVFQIFMLDMKTAQTYGKW